MNRIGIGIGRAGRAYGAACANREGLAPFLAAARTRRVDVVGLGDSNQLAGGYGYDHGMGRALGARFGLYATGVLPASANGQWGAVGYLSYPQGGPFGVTTADASVPAAVKAYNLPDAAMPSYGAYLASGGVQSGALLTLNAGWPGDVTGALRWHGTIVRQAAAGSLEGVLREQTSPYTPLHQPPTLALPTGSGLADVAISYPAGAVASPKDVGVLASNPYAARPVSGPIALLWQRMENAARTRGAAYSTLYAGGGRSTRDCALALQALCGAGRTAGVEYVRQLARLQGVPPAQAMACVQVAFNGNDLADAAPAAGTFAGAAHAASNTPAGVAENVREVLDRMAELWAAAGYDAANLYALWGPYHGRAGQEAQQQANESAVAALTAAYPRLCVVRGTALLPAAECAAYGWLGSGGTDPYHLSPQGYEAAAERLMAALGA